MDSISELAANATLAAVSRIDRQMTFDELFRLKDLHDSDLHKTLGGAIGQDGKLQEHGIIRSLIAIRHGD